MQQDQMFWADLTGQRPCYVLEIDRTTGLVSWLEFVLNYHGGTNHHTGASFVRHRVQAVNSLVRPVDALRTVSHVVKRDVHLGVVKWQRGLLPHENSVVARQFDRMDELTLNPVKEHESVETTPRKPRFEIIIAFKGFTFAAASVPVEDAHVEFAVLREQALLETNAVLDERVSSYCMSDRLTIMPSRDFLRTDIRDLRDAKTVALEGSISELAVRDEAPTTETEANDS